MEKHVKVVGLRTSGDLEMPKKYIKCHKCGSRLFKVHYDQDRLLTVECAECGEVELRE